MLAPHHTNVFGLYHALADRFTSLGMFSLSQNILSCIEFSPGCCPQLPTGHRSQVTAGLLVNSNTPSRIRCRPSTRVHSRCVHGHKLLNELLPSNHTPSCRVSTEFDRRCVHGHMLSNEISPGRHTPSFRRYHKATIQSYYYHV